MPSQTRSPGTVAIDTSIGNETWTDTDNAKVSDDARASCATLKQSESDVSYYLKCTNYGFSVPSDATVSGIEVSVEWRERSFGVRQHRFRIVKGGTIGSDSTYDDDGVYPTDTPGVEEIDVKGGSTALWGETWAYSDVNAPTFGVAIAVKHPSFFSGWIEIDHVAIKVYYTGTFDIPVDQISEVDAALPMQVLKNGTWIAMQLDGSTWTDISQYMRSWGYRRGRPTNLDRIEAGVAQLELIDSQGRFDPINPNSPLYPDLVPLQPVRIRHIRGGVIYPRFYGRIERFRPAWAFPDYQFMQIDAADAFEELANTRLVGPTAQLITTLAGNKVANPSFETDTTSWASDTDTADSATLTRVADTDFDAGDYAGQLAVAGDDGESAFVYTTDYDNVVAAGDTVVFKSKVKLVSSTALPYSLAMRARWMSDSGGTFHSRETIVTQADPVTNQVYQLEGTAVAPSGATRIGVELRILIADDATFRVDDVYIGIPGNADLQFTAVEAGRDDIVVEYVVAGTSTSLDTSTNKPTNDDHRRYEALVWKDRPQTFFLGGLSSQRAPRPVQPTPITVSGTTISVQVATDGGGSPTSTASSVLAGLQANPDVLALVTPALAPGSSGSGVVSALAATLLPGGSYPLERTGARLARVLDAIDNTTTRALDKGYGDVIAEPVPASQNISALAHLLDTADADLGLLFVAGDGALTYHDGDHRSTSSRSTIVRATFSDDGSDWSYHGLEITPLEKDRIANEVEVQPARLDDDHLAGGADVAQTVADEDSQAMYGRRTLSRQTKLVREEKLLAQAVAIRDAYKDPATRIDSITVLDDGTDAWAAAMFDLEIGDLVRVEATPPVVAGATSYQLAYNCLIEAIEETFVVGQPIAITFRLSLEAQSVALPAEE